MPIDLAPHNAYGLRLSSPIMAAAGCLGDAVDLARAASVEQLGALVAPSTVARRLRARPRLLETPAGLLYAGGWPEQGLRHALEQCAPTWAGWATPVLLSVAGDSEHNAADLAIQLEGVEGVAGIELDLSADPERGPAVVAAVRSVTLLPILAKLPAREEGLVELARTTIERGADALVVAAPPPARWQDESGAIEGRLCGPAWHPLALRLVALVAAAVTAPVVGCGGVADSGGARRMLAAGAQAVQVGSALLSDPGLAARIASELA